MFHRKSVVPLAMIFSGCLFAFTGRVVLAAPPANPGAITNSLPPKIITTDGVTYNAPKLLSIQPDGLLVEFQPAVGGAGLAKLKFAKLPESLQKQFGYDSKKAADYEREQSLAMSVLAQKLQQDAQTNTALLNEMSQRLNLTGAVSVNSFDPTVTYNYYAPGQKPDTLQGDISTCRYTYECHADFEVHSAPGTAGEPVHFYIDKVKISLEMSCYIIEPEAPFDYIRIHEEWRRKVYEYVYRFGPQLANRIGESMIGREFISPGSDLETAKANALVQAGAQFKMQYLYRLDSAAQAANLYFEKLTDYNNNNFDPSRAFQETIEKFGKDFQN
jgi:hypothetical protein